MPAKVPLRVAGRAARSTRGPGSPACSTAPRSRPVI